MKAKIIKFFHRELGPLEVLVTGTRHPNGHGLENFKVYYGAYEITKDLDEQDRLAILGLATKEND